MTKTYITDEMRSLIGRTMYEATSFPISANEIRKWAMAIYYPEIPPRIFWDDEFAATTHYGGIVAPEEYNPFAWTSARPGMRQGGTSHGGFEAVFGMEPPPHKAVLQGEKRVTYSGVRMRPGDVIELRQFISEYFEREGRMGLMLYTTITDTYTNQRGEHIKNLDTVFVRYE
ncbi:MAG: MaoC family dehydratase N-terminal domain-containing protein [Acidimicrobiia bacterium]